MGSLALLEAKITSEKRKMGIIVLVMNFAVVWYYSGLWW